MVNAATGEVAPAARQADRSLFSTQATGRAPGGALVVEGEFLEGGGRRLTLRSLVEPEGTDGEKVLLQERDEGGGWRTAATIEPAAHQRRLGLCAPAHPGRRVFPGSWELVEIAPVLSSGGQDLALTSARHSSAGDLGAKFWSGDGSVSLAPGETLELVYELSELSSAPEGSWFALLERTDGATATARDVESEDAADLPLAFALHQNQPNPFRGTTAIHFDLPRSVSVRLTIYDIVGRKVRTLVEGEQPAGRHAAVWDMRSDAGPRLRTGAYIYRLEAAEFREERKMILLP